MIMDETMGVSTIHEIPRIEIVFCPDCDTDNEQEAGRVDAMMLRALHGDMM